MRICLCCGYKTLNDPTAGNYEVCPVCSWEDDLVQSKDPDFEGGANKISLKKAQQNFLERGVDNPEYEKDLNWKPIE